MILGGIIKDMLQFKDKHPDLNKLVILKKNHFPLIVAKLSKCIETNDLLNTIFILKDYWNIMDSELSRVNLITENSDTWGYICTHTFQYESILSQKPKDLLECLLIKENRFYVATYSNHYWSIPLVNHHSSSLITNKVVKEDSTDLWMYIGDAIVKNF